MGMFPDTRMTDQELADTLAYLAPFVEGRKRAWLLKFSRLSYCHLPGNLAESFAGILWKLSGWPR